MNYLSKNKVSLATKFLYVCHFFVGTDKTTFFLLKNKRVITEKKVILLFEEV